jgi:predicted nucleic acid-binding protein
VNVVDSSGWLEFFGDGPNASVFAPPILATTELLVPSIALYEVFKRARTSFTEDAALETVSVMVRARVVELDRDLALAAADLSLELSLPMADSIILATARAYRATLWSQDADFEGLPDVRYVARAG